MSLRPQKQHLGVRRSYQVKEAENNIWEKGLAVWKGAV